MPEIVETEVNSSILGAFSDSPVMQEPKPTVPPPVSRAEVEKKAEEIADKRKLPTKPGVNVTFQELIKWLKLLNGEQASRISIYVYRFRPVIVRQQANPDADNNIDILCDGFQNLSERYFIDNHGGGTYGLTVTDSDQYRGTKSDTGFFKAKLEIPIAEYPPKLDLREVDWTNEKNKGYQAWARAKNLIDSQNMPITPTSSSKDSHQNGSGNAGSDNTVQLMKLFMEFIKEEKAKGRNVPDIQPDPMSKAMGEIFLEKVKQDDPNKATNGLMQMFTALIAAMKPDKSGDTSQMAMFQMMMENQKANTQILLEMMKSNNESKSGGDGGGNEITKLRELLELTKELKGGGSDKRSTTEVLIDKGLDVIGPALNMVGNIVMLKMQASGVQPPLGQVPMNKSQQHNPQATMQNPNQLPSSTQSPEEMSHPSPGQPQPTNFDLVAVLHQFGPLILQNLEKEGWEVADMLSRFVQPGGNALVAGISQHGVDGIVNTMKNIPEFWGQVSTTYGEPHLREWLDQFINYKEIIAQMEAGEDGEGDGDEEGDEPEGEPQLPKPMMVGKVKEK